MLPDHSEVAAGFCPAKGDRPSRRIALCGRVARVAHHIVNFILGHGVLHHDVDVVAIGIVLQIPDYHHLPSHISALAAARVTHT